MRAVGVDIGGTFTDLMLYDTESGACMSTRCARRPTIRAARWSPASLELCGQAGIAPADVDAVFHGTTVATNAVLEHRRRARPGW